LIPPKNTKAKAQQEKSFESAAKVSSPRFNISVPEKDKQEQRAILNFTPGPQG
jgi:hypothetical protein